MNWFKNLKIRTKLITGFSTVIVIFIFTAIIQLIELNQLKDLQDEGAKRNDNAIKINDLQIEVTEIYTVIAEAQLDKDLVESRRQISELKTKAEKNIEALNNIVDSDEEKQNAKIFEDNYKKYLSIFENRLLPAIERSVEGISDEMSTIDDEIETIRNETVIPLEKVAASIEQDSIIGDQLYDETYNQSITILIIFTIIALFIAVGIALFIAFLISKPIKLVSEKAVQLQGEEITNLTSGLKSLSEGDLTTKVNVATLPLNIETQDEVGDLARNINMIINKTKDGIKTFEESRNKIKSMIDETNFLIKSSNDGDLKSRGDSKKFEGAYSELVKGINNILDAIVEPINESAEVLKIMATGDLTIRVKGDYKGDHQIMKKSINELGNSLSKVLEDVSEAVSATASASTQISSSSEEMAAGSHEQSAQTTEVASAVEQMTSTILQTTKNAGSAAEFSKKAGQSAINGGEVVKQTVEGMNRIAEVVGSAASTVKELGNSSNQIGEIIQVIDDIADQTNLLALNAAIEAARAGEQGRGFAVVADEVRKLAERTTKATKEIATMIKQIQKDTGNAVESIESGTKEVETRKELAKKAICALDEIIGSTNETIDVVNHVAAASEEQSSAAEQISKSIEGISSVTQESSLGIQQIAKASEDLSNLTTNLQNLVSKFKIGSDGYNGNRNQNKQFSVRPNGKLIGS